jgi:LysM repeat protein
MNFKVINKCHEDMSSMQGLLKSFLPFARKNMGFTKPPTIMFKSDQGNAQKLLGKTAHYDPTTGHVVVYVTGRHPKDVLRSLSHELVHHAQNCRGEFGNTPDTAPGYAQKDSHMRKMEEEAYKVGNLCFRDWEDGVKSGKIKVSVAIREGLIRENKENYTIVSGDTLSGIAGKFYGDVHMWPLIYINNEQQIGPNPDLIKPGVSLTIPDASAFNDIPKDKLMSIYDRSDYYALDGEELQQIDSEKIQIDSDLFASYGSPARNAEAELRIWRGKKESNPKIEDRLAAMWANIGWRRWSPSIPWSAAAISWFFRDDPNFPKAAGHLSYIQAAKRNRRVGASGYQHFTPEELGYEYEVNDIIGYVPSSTGRVHCDIYVGNDMCIGGNLSNTVKKNRIKRNTVSGEEIVLVLRKMDTRGLKEWKNDELNKLLLEKFNLGVKK